MNNLIGEFKAKMKKEGRSYRWFHREFLSGITYSYFIIQLNDDDKLQDSIKDSISKFINSGI